MGSSPRSNQLFAQCEFVLGAASPHQYPQDKKPEVAFAGRSNVGKSSAINAICQRRKLARTSKIPGRTQEINFFDLSGYARLVDLPGYGFAQVPLEVKKRWQKNIHTYLSQRETLVVLVLLMDCRHPLTELDWQMLNWAAESSLPTQLLLTKADKLKRGQLIQTQAKVEKTVADLPGQFAVEPFSSSSGLGVAALRNQMTEWLVPNW